VEVVNPKAAYAPGESVIWRVSNLQPFETVQIDVAAAEAVSCSNLTATVTIDPNCLGESCLGIKSDDIDFYQPPVAVRSNNAQTADLPMCAVGEVLLRVKNSSGSAFIYNLVMSQVLTNVTYVPGTIISPSAVMTVTDRNGAVVTGLQSIPFEPVITTVDGQTILVWQIISGTTTETQTRILAKRAPEETVVVRYLIRSNCDTPNGGAVRAEAGAQEPCGTFFARKESAFTLQNLETQLSLSKQGKNVTRGGDLSTLSTASRAM
jgi:hypothetical protein